MRRIKLVLAALAVMGTMIAGSAMPAVAHDNDHFRFDGDHNDGFRFDRDNIDDILDFGCLGAVIGFQCFGITTFDGLFFDNNDEVILVE